MARGLMYSAVYFHRVTRVTEVMLSRAVERSEDKLPGAEQMQRKVDSEIWSDLNSAGDYAKDILTRLNTEGSSKSQRPSERTNFPQIRWRASWRLLQIQTTGGLWRTTLHPEPGWNLDTSP